MCTLVIWQKMGLPINKLVVATNQNDILHRAISKGEYTIEKVSETSLLAWIFN